MTAWLVAGALEQLLAQLNALAPNRSKASDGAIGDAAHATRDSDHNPWLVIAGQPYVSARDFTHDPAGGLAGGWLAECLAAGRDPRIKYVIWDRRIMAGAGGPAPWTWRPYSGLNAHQHHVHVSVVADARALVRTAWRLKPSALTGVGAIPIVRQEDADVISPELEQMIRETHREITLRLPNRRGPQGSEIPNGGADTVLGYAANTDGSTFRASWTLDEIQGRLEDLMAVLTGHANATSSGELALDYDALAAALLRAMANPTH